MSVIVYAQDLSGRNDDGYYTKPDISSALDIFFDTPSTVNFVDGDVEHVLSRDDAEAIFAHDGKISFYNADGEKVIITRDPSRST